MTLILTIIIGHKVYSDICQNTTLIKREISHLSSALRKKHLTIVFSCTTNGAFFPYDHYHLGVKCDSTEGSVDNNLAMDSWNLKV